MPRTNWQPTASLNTLQKRADLLQQIRSFFAQNGVMEVELPMLGQHGVTDFHIDCIPASVSGETRFLQSSPEYFMKRLLAAGSGPIYSLGKVFRNEERGRRHSPEFTLLEWYRPQWDEEQLMDEITDLLIMLAGPGLHVQRESYGKVFEDRLGLNPHTASLEALAMVARECCGGDWSAEGRSTLLDLLFSTVVEPSLAHGLVFVYDYPSCMSALARLETRKADYPIARRFELFLHGVELGNGYYELTDPVEQRSRFEADIALRREFSKREMAIDEHFLAAMEAGLPPCAGVAIGVDRLLMQLLGESTISGVLSFGR